MTTTAVIGDSDDGYIESSSTSYASMLSGSNLIVPGSSDPLMFCGQSLASGVRYGWQSFVEFGWTADADELPVAAYVRLRAAQTTGSSTSRDLEVREVDFGTTVNTSDWRTPAQLAAAALKGRVADANGAAGLTMRAGLDLGEVDSTATLRYVLATSRNRLQQAPAGLEWTSLRQAEASNSTAQRPALYVTARTKSYLDLSAGAQVQLSDGTHILLAANGVAGGSVGFDLVHHDGTTPTVIFAGSSVSGRRGAHAYAICRDESDNIYLLNRSGVTNSLNCRVFTKGSGHSWSAGTIYSAALPTYDADINNVAVAWHPQGGTSGTVVAVVGHEPGSSGTQLAYALVSCDYLLTGSGSLLRGSGNAEGVFVNASAPDGFNNYINETGSLLDVTAVRDANGTTSAIGYVTSTAKHQILGSNNSQSVGRYVLNSSGTGFASSARSVDSTSGFSVKDADAKSRVIPVSDSQWVTVNVSTSDDFGIVAKHRQFSAGSFSTLADVRLDAEGLTTMPEPSVLATSSAWDAVYDPATGYVWVYYVDTADSNRLMKTHIDLNTGLAAADEEEVNAAVSATGSTSHAIRVHRGEMAGQQVLVSVASETSGGSHSLIYVTDDINQAPTAPGLVSEPNFDATADATFEWVFNDPNSSDTQSAFQLEIYDDATDTLSHDTTKTASGTESYTLTGGTISNGATYRWRVRTWDAADAEGPWSGFSYFATSASGNVTVVDPASDNEALEAADLTIEWDVTGATQEDYRVVVVRTDTLATHSDTGWVTSADVTYTVTGLLSEVEYEIQVTIRDTGVESSTGTRLVTPDYTYPEAPVVTVSGVDDGAYIQVSVDNPEPGDLVSTLDGEFEAGVDGWSTEAPRLVGSESARDFAGTVTVPVPSGTSDGDLMLLAVTSNFDHTFTVDAAWGSAVQTVTTTTDGHGLSIYQRIASSEPASYDTTWTNPSNWHSAAIVTLRGVKELGAFDSDTTDSATSLDHPSITVGLNDWALLVGHTAESGARTEPGTVTVLESQEHGVIVGYEPQDTAGTAGPWTLSYAGAANGMITMSQALTAAATVEQSTLQAFGGSNSALVTAQGTPATAGIRPTAANRAEVTVNERYTIEAMAYSAAGATVRAQIDWYDTNGDLLSSDSNDTAVASGTWTEVSHTAAAPAGATHAGYGPALVSPSDAEELWVDNVELRTASDVPEPTANQIWRSEGDSTPILLATVDPGDAHRDYMAGSGRTYTYYARAVAADGSTTDSATVEGTVRYQGVWIHDPDDPETTIAQYLYGRSQRSDSSDKEQTLQHFVGRQHPVTQWGEHTTDSWQITVNVPEGADRLASTDSLRDWDDTRDTLVCRDNRGRVFVSTMSGFGVDDQDWGDSVSFTMTRVSSDLAGGEV